jgi:hypothetical protein
VLFNVSNKEILTKQKYLLNDQRYIKANVIMHPASEAILNECIKDPSRQLPPEPTYAQILKKPKQYYKNPIKKCTCVKQIMGIHSLRMCERKYHMCRY